MAVGFKNYRSTDIIWHTSRCKHFLGLFNGFVEAQTSQKSFFEEDFEFSVVLKNYSVRMHDPEGSFAERAIEYMTNMQKLLSKNVFLFVNCNAYLTMNDYAYIEQCASYYDLYILFICNQQIRLNHSGNEYIIDIDLCEIH